MFPSTYRPIHHLYFLLIFLFLAALTTGHFLRICTSFDQSIGWLFYLLGITECFLETVFLLLVAQILHRSGSRSLFAIYIGGSALLLLGHFTDFSMIRVLDTPFTSIFFFFFGNGWQHFLIAWEATNINAWMGLLILFSIGTIPIAGYTLYRLCGRISQVTLFARSIPKLFMITGSLASLLLISNLLYQPLITQENWIQYRHLLPLNFLCHPPPLSNVNFPLDLLSTRNEVTLNSQLAQMPLHVNKRPNIYLFIIETLRPDFITPEIAPHLHQFAKKSPPLISYANANGSHLSWFSILHAQYPNHWTKIRDEWKEGSFPLKIFKQLGYEVRLYSAAELRYFHMDEIVFGANRALVDASLEASRDLETYKKDQTIIDSLVQEIDKHPKEGILSLIFLDSTHSEYSFPSEEEYFQPIADRIDYLTISPGTPALEQVKNRYRNAIHWVDTLVGRFLEQLKIKDLYDESLIVITGDHAEEFYEEGALFHGTHLNEWQLRVPCLYKCSLLPPKHSFPLLSSHVDILPTLLHCVTGEPNWKSYVDGESIFDPSRKNFIWSFQVKGCRPPLDFLLLDQHTQIWGRFDPSQFKTSGDSKIGIIKTKTTDPEPEAPLHLIERAKAGL